ncbi:NUDIX domain-containing protein [Polaromonas sp.]|uniref:NUDIX hydrolase n=1 Tax=Polaromonas sp. TaxID=1869339 RepID=UPI00286BE589|nr:NUDIX domain-containing protein [Polaromonas sp.]
MRNNPLNPLWLARLQAYACQPPVRDRVPLYVGPAMVGSVEPDFLDQVVSSATRPSPMELRRETHREGVCWRLLGEPTGAMALLANALRDSGLAGVWRDEQLGVTDLQGQRVGSIERAAVRPLGITTHAVHLVGTSPDGRIWVQQRALNKANDPGLWDTLVGGMVASVDTTETALKRETWEEAGLHLSELDAVAHRGRVTVSRPSPDGRGAGYLQEHVDWFTATVPSCLNPVNQDREVAQFALLSQDELVLWLEQDLFTVEAALVLMAALGLN